MTNNTKPEDEIFSRNVGIFSFLGSLVLYLVDFPVIFPAFLLSLTFSIAVYKIFGEIDPNNNLKIDINPSQNIEITAQLFGSFASLLIVWLVSTYWLDSNKYNQNTNLKIDKKQNEFDTVYVKREDLGILGRFMQKKRIGNLDKKKDLIPFKYYSLDDLELIEGLSEMSEKEYYHPLVTELIKRSNTGNKPFAYPENLFPVKVGIDENLKENKGKICFGSFEWWEGAWKRGNFEKIRISKKEGSDEFVDISLIDLDYKNCLDREEPKKIFISKADATTLGIQENKDNIEEAQFITSN